MSTTPTAIGRAPVWLRHVLGEASGQIRVAHRLAVVSATVTFVAATVLIATHVAYVWGAGEEKARVVTLEEQTKDDPEVAARLHDERKRQTDASLARETRSRALAWALLVAAGAFVAAGKWYQSLRPERVPTLEELVAARFGGVAGEGVREKRAGAKEGGQEPRLEGVVAVEPRGGGAGTVASEAADLGFVDGLIDRLGRDREAAIPILQAIQAHYRYLPDEALRHVCERTEITPAQIAGTSSFYAQFRRSPVGRHVVRVCHGTACHVAGAEQITEELRRHLDIPAGADTDARRQFTIDKVACLGCCSLAPVMMIEEDTAGRLTPATARQALEAVARKT